MDHSICKAVIYMVEAREASFSKLSTSVKHRNNEVKNDQATLINFYESSSLSKKWKESIDIAIIKVFVYCSLSWFLIEHPFVIELLKQLRPNYKPPDQKDFIDTLLTQEILRVSVKYYRLLDNEDNLILGKYFYHYFWN